MQRRASNNEQRWSGYKRFLKNKGQEMRLKTQDFEANGQKAPASTKSGCSSIRLGLEWKAAN